MKIIKYFFFPLLVLGTMAYLFLAWNLSNKILHPRPSNLQLSKARMVENWNTTYEAVMAPFPAPSDFSVQTHDDLTLKGWYFKQADTAKCAVILAHGWTATKEGAMKYANIYWDCACDLIVYDQRGHGESDDAYGTAGVLEKKDLITVTQWLKQTTDFKAEQIAWVGSSWGASAVIQAATMDEKVAFAVADSPFQDWYSAIFERAVVMYGAGIEWLAPSIMGIVSYRSGIDYQDASALKAAPHIKIPVLLIHSKTDEQTASSQSVNISKQMPKDKHVFHHTDWGGKHTQDVLINPEGYAELVAEFVEKFELGFGECR